MERILVLRGGALGDFIVTLPALAGLRTRYPRARIELAGNATAATLAQARGVIDTVHSQHEARWASLYGSAALEPEFHRWLTSFDAVLNFWPDPDGELAARFPRRAGQRYLSAAALPGSAPAARHYAQAWAPLGIDVTAVFHPLAPLAPVRPLPSGTVACHPGSGSPRKNWPAERWRALLASLDCPVLLLLGEAEHEAWSEQALPAQVQAVRGAALESLVERLAGCALFIGHDSGISHLAAACGVRSILLFGPTDPAVWAPPAPHVQVLRKGPSVADLSLEDVRAAVAQARPHRG